MEQVVSSAGSAKQELVIHIEGLCQRHSLSTAGLLALLCSEVGRELWSCVVQGRRGSLGGGKDAY